MKNIPLIVVLGATASGKTALSIEIAKKFDGEIVSADSMQIYKFMDIGTAKPDDEEKCGIPHHMIDIVTPDVNFSVAQYCKMAHEVIEDITRRGKLPVLTGGTGLYINSVVNDVDFEESEENTELRKELEIYAKTNGAEALHKILEECDPKSAEIIHANNIKRVIRAIEVFKETGVTLSEHNEKSKLKMSRYSPILLEISWDREILYERINKRVDIMLEKGLENEARMLYNMGYTKNSTAMQGIGYKEMFDYFDGLCDFETAVDKIKQGSRNYAKRQNTWFKRDERINKLNPLFAKEEAFKLVTKFLGGN